MAQIVTAPERYLHLAGMRVFLAGAIDMGAAVNWQATVIERLKSVDDLVLLNPRRAAFTPDTLDEQIRWELDALSVCHYIFMWLPKDSKAPISLFEAGLYWKSKKLIIGAQPGFYRRRNLELTGDRYSVLVHKSLKTMLAELEICHLRSIEHRR